jgi:NAD-reducing hydrogenase large subunit
LATTSGNRIVIEPVTRVEGHGKVTIHLDDRGEVREARLHIVEFRGFERFIQGRPYWELPVVVQRLCGICPVSHHLARPRRSTGSSAGRTSPRPRRRCGG